MKFVESYSQTLSQVNVFSKITSLLMIVFVFSDFFENIYAYIAYAEQGWINEFLGKILLSNGFIALIGIIFIFRFIFLWYKKPKNLWLSQFFWLIGWLAILAFAIVTEIFYGNSSNNFSTSISDAFVWSSEGLAICLLAYLCLSPIKQILVLLFAFFSRNSPRNA